MNATFQTPVRILACILVSAVVPVALAGPPLVCWQVDTGGAASLPWTDNPRSYEGMSADYDTHRLVPDTLALLTPATPVLARMETLRRASLYGNRDHEAREALLKRLVARTRESGGALAFFDAGYFVEASKQAASVNEPEVWSRLLSSLGIREDPGRELGTPKASGYDWVARAIDLSGGDPEMEYAAALITWHPRRPEHDVHVRRAAAGAVEGSPLGRNLGKHFP